ncbi:MAG: beta-lactamase family protein [Burkholderiales bacterium]|nr:beta-lactamase family protein [Burkholderiales bacterium]
MRSLAPLAAVAALALALTTARLCAAPAEVSPAASAPGSAPAAAAAASAPIAPALPAHALTAQDAQAWLDGLMPTALRTARTPGAVVVIVKDGQVLLEKGYGYADEKKRAPVDPARTLFRPGSTSKLFTWTAVMQLVEQGKLDLDTDVNKYLDFQVPPRDGQPITLRQVMTHRAGFEERIKDLVAFDIPETPLAEVLSGNMPARIYAAGTTSAYSNYATGLAGHIVERVSGLSFNDYIEKNVFAPLDMTHSTFRQPPPGALLADMSTGYEESDKPGKGFEVVNIPPAGSLSSTGHDMAHFMIAHLADGQYGNARILKPETAHMMHTTITRPFPDLNGMALGFYQDDINGHPVIAHGGDLNYFHSDLWLFLDDHVGVFISVNALGKEGLGEGIRDDVFHEFADRYFPRSEPVQPIDEATAKAHAQVMAGRYQTTRRGETTFLSLINMIQPTTLTANPDGSLTTKLLLHPQTFVETKPWLWHEVGGHDQLQARVVDGKVMTWSTDYLAFAFAYEPLHGLAGAGLEVPLLVLSLALMLAAVLAWPVGAAARRWYGAAPLPAAVRTSTRWLAAAAIAALVAAVAWTALFAVVAAITAPHLDTWLHVVQLLSFIGFLGGWLVAGWNLVRRVQARVPGRRGAIAWATLQFAAFTMVLYVAASYHLLNFSAGY